MNLKHLSDNELIENFIKTKDKRYFGELYKRYLKQTYKFVYSKVGSKDDTEDIVAETFFILIDVIDKYNFNCKFSTFVFGIAFNKIKQHWQLKEKQKTVELVDEITAINNSIYFKESNGKKPDLAEILDSLPENYKLVLEERFLKMKSIRDTANHLGLSEANVRVIQNRALKKAKNLLNIDTKG